MTNRVLAFNDSFTSATAPTGLGGGQEDYTIANNASGGALFTLDHTVNKSAFMNYELRRTSSLGTYLQTGQLMIAYNDTAWVLSQGAFEGDNMLVGTISNTEHVKLILNASSGVLTYDSGNLAGTGYAGTLKLDIVRIA